MTTWLTDDPCPACGTGLHCDDTGAAVDHVCPACGWTTKTDLAGQAGGRR